MDSDSFLTSHLTQQFNTGISGIYGTISIPTPHSIITRNDDIKSNFVQLKTVTQNALYNSETEKINSFYLLKFLTFENMYFFLNKLLLESAKFYYNIQFV
jgi:hypothetical protein